MCERSWCQDLRRTQAKVFGSTCLLNGRPGGIWRLIKTNPLRRQSQPPSWPRNCTAPRHSYTTRSCLVVTSSPLDINWKHTHQSNHVVLLSHTCLPPARCLCHHSRDRSWRWRPGVQARQHYRRRGRHARISILPCRPQCHPRHLQPAVPAPQLFRILFRPHACFFWSRGESMCPHTI